MPSVSNQKVVGINRKHFRTFKWRLFDGHHNHNFEMGFIIAGKLLSGFDVVKRVEMKGLSMVGVAWAMEEQYILSFPSGSRLWKVVSHTWEG